MNYFDTAKEKLDGEIKSVSGNKEKAMCSSVKEVLLNFCHQDDEFAQAVADGGSLKDCMEAVAKNVGSSISDLEAYRRAVQFYFKGADIRFQMTIDLIGQLDKDGAPADVMGPKVLDLADFF